MHPADIAPLAALLTVFVAFFGACIGSFLNVCIYRIPREESIVRPRSHCPSCGHAIPWYLNIPVLSWFMLAGRCRYCRSPIAFRYVAVELLTALLFLLVWLKYAAVLLDPSLAEAWQPGADLPVRGGLLSLVPAIDPWLLPAYWLVVMGLVLGTFVDLEHMILPDRVTIGGMVLGLLLSPMIPSLHATDAPGQALLAAGIGCGLGFGGLWLVATLGTLAFRKEAMGFGDVKLMGALGAFFGWQAVLFCIIASSFLGSLVGVGLIAAGKRRLQSRIPYGPFIAAAAMIWMLWGPLLWNLYLRMLRPEL